jgi:hypothetical protein
LVWPVSRGSCDSRHMTWCPTCGTWDMQETGHAGH